MLGGRGDAGDETSSDWPRQIQSACSGQSRPRPPEGPPATVTNHLSVACRNASRALLGLSSRLGRIRRTRQSLCRHESDPVSRIRQQEKDKLVRRIAWGGILGALLAFLCITAIAELDGVPYLDAMLGHNPALLEDPSLPLTRIRKPPKPPSGIQSYLDLFSTATTRRRDASTPKDDGLEGRESRLQHTITSAQPTILPTTDSSREPDGHPPLFYREEVPRRRLADRVGVRESTTNGGRDGGGSSGGTSNGSLKEAQLVIAGKMLVEDAPCNIAQFNLKAQEWSLTERIQLSLYNSYSGGEVYSLLANHTTSGKKTDSDRNSDSDSSRR